MDDEVIGLLKKACTEYRLKGYSYDRIAECIAIPEEKLKKLLRRRPAMENLNHKRETLNETLGSDSFRASNLNGLNFPLCSGDYIVEYPNDPSDIIEVTASVDALIEVEDDERIRVVIVDKNIISEELEKMCDGILIQTKQDLDEHKWIWQ